MSHYYLENSNSRRGKIGTTINDENKNDNMTGAEMGGIET